MPDGKQFEITIVTTATGDGAEVQQAKLEALAASIKVISTELVAAQQKLTDLEWGADGSRESTAAIAKQEEAVAKLKLKLAEAEEAQRKLTQTEEVYKQTTKEAGKVTEEVGEQLHISTKKAMAMAGALSQIAAAAISGESAMSGLEKLSHVISGIAAASGHVEIALLVSGFTSFFHTLLHGDKAHEQEEDYLKKLEDQIRKTAAALHEMAEKRRVFEEQQHDAHHTWEPIYEEIDRIVKRLQDALAAKRKLMGAEKEADIAEVREREREDTDPGRHERAEKRVQDIEREYREKDREDQQKQIALPAHAAEVRAKEIVGEVAQAREERDRAIARGEAAAERELREALAARERERIKTAQQDIDLMRQGGSTGSAIALSESDFERLAAAQLKEIREAEKRVAEADAEIRRINAEHPGLASGEEEVKKAEEAREEFAKDVAAKEKELRALEETWKRAKTAEAERKKLAEQEDRLIEIKDREKLAAAKEKDQKEAARKVTDETRPAEKGVRDAQHAVSADEAALNKENAAIHRAVHDLVSTPAFKQGDTSGQLREQLESIARRLALNAQNEKALQDLAALIARFHPAANTEAGEAVAAIRQGIANTETTIGILRQHQQALREQSAQLEAIRRKADQ